MRLDNLVERRPNAINHLRQFRALRATQGVEFLRLRHRLTQEFCAVCFVHEQEIGSSGSGQVRKFRPMCNFGYNEIQ